MNKFIINFLNNLEDNSIKYCHFKSNNNLELALSGIDDLDLLIDINSRNSFLKLISFYGFKEAYGRNEERNPFIFHYFGLDQDTGLILHLHIYFKLITGGSILKNTWIPLEKEFLNNTLKHPTTGVIYAANEIDLLLFLIRKSIEQTSFVEHYLFLKDYKNIANEHNWLQKNYSLKNFKKLINSLRIFIPFNLIENLQENFINSNFINRIFLGIKVRKYFKLNLVSNFYAEIKRLYLFFKAYIDHKFFKKKSSRFLFPGGLIIAFVGPEAAGKSTLSKHINHWLSERFDTHYIHMGKPQKSYKTKIFWEVLNFYSKLKKMIKNLLSIKKNLKEDTQEIKVNMPKPFISYLDSIDRKHQLLNATKKMLKGSFIITDRYPNNSIDGARIKPKTKFESFLSKLEIRNYRSLPEPDIVFHIHSPLKTTLERNNKRDNPEPISFVLERYKLAEEIKFNHSTTIKINTDKSIEENLVQIKKVIWGQLN